MLEDIPQAIRACRVSVKTGGQFRWLPTTASSAQHLAALWQFTRRLSVILQLALRWQIDIRHPPSRDLVPLKRTGYGGYGGRLSGSKGTAMCCRRITFQAILKVLGEDVHTGFH